MTTATPSALVIPETLYLVLTCDVTDTTVSPILNSITGLMNGGCRELHLMFASTGGSVAHGMTLHNVLRALPMTIITHNTSNIDSIANVVFLAADERHATANASFFFHGVSLTVESDHADLGIVTDWLNTINALELRVATTIASNTDLSVDRVLAMFREGVTMDAQTALGHGLITHIDTEPLPPGTVVMPLVLS
jgi:ATP-dependent protease ClpP protease subunit